MSTSMKLVEVDWNGELSFVGKNSKGSTVFLGDASSPKGISPMELLLIGLAGCTAMDVVSILDKKRIRLNGFKVSVLGYRSEEHPRVYKQIEVTYLLWGNNLRNQDVELAIRLSEERYCSASAMLGKTASIKSNYQINPREFLPAE